MRGRKIGLLVACALGVSGAVTLGAGAASAAPGVTPSSVTLNLSPGQSTTVAKTVSTPPIPPNPDIVFVVDRTGSMGDVIANVQANAPTILHNVKTAQSTAEFAVVGYKDIAADGAAAFTVLQNLTGDESVANAGISHLSPVGGGGDVPEDGINALYQTASGAISFRPGSSRVVIWIGDASSHNPSGGHTQSDAISALQAAHIRVLALDVGPDSSGDGLNATGQAAAIASATGGQLFSGVQTAQVSNTIISSLHNLPVTVSTTLQNCDPHLTVSQDPNTQTPTSGDDALFTEHVTLANDAMPGSTITCTVHYTLNGAVTPGFDETITENVPKAAPSLGTTPSASAPAGGAISDSATLSGAYNPTGTVQFQLFGPGDTSCATPIATSFGTISGNSANSGPILAGGVGTYLWTASYAGDAHNSGAVSPCGSEQVVVTKATPSISTTPSAGVPAGGLVHDSATVSGGYLPTGTVTFQLFGPGDTTCTTSLGTRTVPLSSTGTATTPDLVVGRAGTYNWVATYNGDTNNNSVAGRCGDEKVVVTPQILTGRAYGLAAGVALLGAPLLNIFPTPDTGRVTTTSTSLTSPPCVLTISGLIVSHTVCASVETNAFPGRSTAQASIDDTSIGIPGLPVITIKVVQSSSTTSCAGSSGSTTIAYLQVGSVVVIGAPTQIARNTTVNVGVVKLVLNEQRAFSTPDKGLTVNAVHLTVNALGLATTDVVLASSESDIGNCP